MTRSALIWGALALWAVVMGASIVALNAEPTGDGFVRGMNRVTGFLLWQLAAAMIAAALWISSSALPKGSLMRWLVRVPGWWCVAFVVLFVGFVMLLFLWPTAAAP